jgi:poly(3-hydroxybutyrate) depolymerase
MNALADQHGFVVAYPAQEARANGSKCWNWFRKEDQTRDRGEPALIAGITRELAAAYRIDDRRIFVRGLSAGAHGWHLSLR